MMCSMHELSAPLKDYSYAAQFCSPCHRWVLQADQTSWQWLL